MNARTLLAMLVALTLGGNAFAETATDDGAEPEVGQASPSDSFLDAASHAATGDVKPGAFLDSPDFRNVRMTDGMFGDPSRPMFRMFGAGMFIASGADLASTEYALSLPGIHEANPLQRNRSIRFLSHAAAPVAMYYLTEKLHDSGKPKLALLARIGFTVGYSYVVMHNLRTAATAP